MIPAQNWKILVRTDFSEKFRVVPKWPQKRIFKFLKNCSLLFPGFIMHVHVIHHVLKQTIYLGKFWFLSYWPKCSQPIRFLNQVCLSNRWISLDFCILIQIQKILKIDIKTLSCSVSAPWADLKYSCHRYENLFIFSVPGEGENCWVVVC